MNRLLSATQETKLFSKLLQLPFFLGMGKNDMEYVVAKTRFEFLKYSAQHTIVHEGDKCEHLYLLTDGTLIQKRYSDNRHYSLEEEIHAPGILEPHRLFGLHQRFSASYLTHTKCHLIRLTKAEMIRLTTDFEIFRINVLNMLSTTSQKFSDMPWRPEGNTIRQKITSFIAQHSIKPAGWKKLNIKMEELAKLINESRINVAQEIRKMESEGFIRHSRGSLVVDALEKLM